MATLEVRHEAGDRWAAQVRGHELFFDQPDSAGGGDSAPTPVEVFVSALAACVAHYARGYLVRHGLPADGLSVRGTYVMAARPARVGDVTLHIVVPDRVPQERLAGLQAVASACTIHNTLLTPPAVSIELTPAAAEAAR